MDLVSPRKNRQYWMAIVVSVFTAFGGILVGFDTGTIGGVIAMGYFKEKFGYIRPNGTYELDATDKSLIVSILSVGTFCGALLGYPFADFIGRRWGIIAACAIFTIGAILEIVAAVLPLFIVGRAVVGVGLGTLSCIIPIYQSECAPKAIRGAIVSIFPWFFAIGLLIASIISYGTKNIDSSACYQIPFGIQLIWVIILVIGMIILPESPRYLVVKNRIDQAHKSQAILLSSKPDDPQVKSDINELIAHSELMKQYGSNTYADCFKLGSQKNLYRTLVGIVLQACQPLTGICFIFYYGTSFFTGLGISNPFLMTIIIDLVNAGMTIFGMLLMDKIGRRNILIIGAIGMSLSQYIIAIVGTSVGQLNNAAEITLIVFVCLNVAFFATSWNSIPWVYTSELYPTPIRAKCMSLSTASNWLFNFLLVFSIPYMVDPGEGNLGLQIFFVWGSTCLGCLIFAIFCIWETKGLSLEQVNYLVRNSSPITSAALNHQLKQDIFVENEVTAPNELNDMSNKTLDGSMDMSNIGTDIDNSNENTSLLGK